MPNSIRQLRHVLAFVTAFFLSILQSGCVAKSTYNDLKDELVQTRESLVESQQQVVDLETTLWSSKLDLEEIRESKDAFRKKCDELSAIKEELEGEKQELSEQAKTYKQLADSLKDEIETGKVTISKMQSRLTVNVIDKILFESGKAEIKNEGAQTLDKVASVLKDIKDKQILVSGHTDNVPIGSKIKDRFPTNWELSTARATAVVRYLAQKHVPEESLMASGRAMFDPVASNETDEGRQKNRRIEIVLAPPPLSETSAQE